MSRVLAPPPLQFRRAVTHVTSSRTEEIICHIANFQCQNIQLDFRLKFCTPRASKYAMTGHFLALAPSIHIGILIT